MVRIGILTYFASINYGAFLQAYALQRCLEERYSTAAEVEMINYTSRIAHDIYIKRAVSSSSAAARRKMISQYDKFVQSREKLRLSEGALISDDIGLAEKYMRGKYDVIIAGSDQIWKTDGMRGFPNAYWLNFDLGRTVRMAYAVSGRNDYSLLNPEMQRYMEASISRFAYIGTRDEITRAELLEIGNRKVERNCDPVFINPKLFQLGNEDTDKKRIKEKYGLNPDKPLISIMTSHSELGKRICRMLENDNQVIFLFNMNEYYQKYSLPDLSPFEWNEVINASDLVITDFFHGTAFSLIHGVPFVALEQNERGRGKIENLLHENNMEDKLLYIRDYEGEPRRLAIAIYTKARKAMRDSVAVASERAVEKESKKAEDFYRELDNVIGFLNAD